MARPKTREPRKLILTVPVTRDERKLFNALAAERHTSLSEVVRQVLYRELEQQKLKKQQNAA
jgi:hypothetical protein